MPSVICSVIAVVMAVRLHRPVVVKLPHRAAVVKLPHQAAVAKRSILAAIPVAIVTACWLD
ncbi:MAG: hypothetical protein D6753_05905 [Planctomycetota bacterium]|nr:MAG: hypothetical protein D6753_05905 [Planctomycetota bacterium]